MFHYQKEPSQMQVIHRSSQLPEASELHPAGTDWSLESNKPIRKISGSERTSSLLSGGKSKSSRRDWTGQSNFRVLETSQRSQTGLPPDARPSPASQLERRIGMSAGFILGQVSTTKLHSDAIRWVHIRERGRGEECLKRISDSFPVEQVPEMREGFEHALQKLGVNAFIKL